MVGWEERDGGVGGEGWWGFEWDIGASVGEGRGEE